MARVALVTGGTRGIGAAISAGLKDAGYKVAASYAGNDEAANAFKAETGILVYKWDVGDFDACQAGVRQVEADLGPVEEVQSVEVELQVSSIDPSTVDAGKSVTARVYGRAFQDGATVTIGDADASGVRLIDGNTLSHAFAGRQDL